jgi:hypothetical protein
MSDLVVWFRQQLETDEVEINRHPDGEDDGLAGYEAQVETNYPCFPYLRVDKATALRQVEAHRAILDEHEGLANGACNTCSEGMFSGEHQVYPCRTIKALASIYSDRNGYRQEWSSV